MAKRSRKRVETLTHGEGFTQEHPHRGARARDGGGRSKPVEVAYERRNRDLDPQLVWRGKDEQNWSDLVVQAPPLFIQEKVHPKALINDLLRHSQSAEAEKATRESGFQTDPVRRLQWPAQRERAHRVLPARRQLVEPDDPGDSLQVMASLAEREGLRGKVQCIYLDPPYGIKFNSTSSGPQPAGM